MTREEFLTKMDIVKNYTNNRDDYTCNTFKNHFNKNVVIEYRYLFNCCRYSNSKNDAFILTDFNYINNDNSLLMTRLTALELFEIISLEEKLYLEY